MKTKQPVVIQPGDYPVLSAERARALKIVLHSKDAAEATAKVLADNIAPLREAVIAALPRLEAAGMEATKVYAAAHEIRGLAGNAGLEAAAGMAGGLCLYLDAILRSGRKADPALIEVHVAAIGRAARALDEENGLSLHVAKELAQLVESKLGEIP